MTSDRDQLAELIHDAVYSGAQRVNWEDIADEILAAGWRAPEPEHEWNEDSCVRCGMRYDQSAGTFCPQDRGPVTRKEHADDDDDEYGEWEKIHPDDDLDG